MVSIAMPCDWLQAKQKEVAAILTKSPPELVTDGGAGLSVHPLTDAWNEVNKQMEYRKMLLDQSIAFHSSAIQVPYSLLHTSPHRSPHLRSHHLSLPRLFTPEVKTHLFHKSFPL